MVLALRADSICPNSIPSNLSSLAPKTILSGTKLGRVSDPYGGRARDGADQNEPKERAPRRLGPFARFFAALSCFARNPGFTFRGKPVRRGGAPLEPHLSPPHPFASRLPRASPTGHPLPDVLVPVSLPAPFGLILLRLRCSAASNG